MAILLFFTKEPIFSLSKMETTFVDGFRISNALRDIGFDVFMIGAEKPPSIS